MTQEEKEEQEKKDGYVAVFFSLLIFVSAIVKIAIF